MGTVAIQVEMRRPGVEPDLRRLSRGDMRLWGMPRQNSGTPVPGSSTNAQIRRAAGEVAPR